MSKTLVITRQGTGFMIHRKEVVSRTSEPERVVTLGGYLKPEDIPYGTSYEISFNGDYRADALLDTLYDTMTGRVTDGR